jgi:hypothetical protein
VGEFLHFFDRDDFGEKVIDDSLEVPEMGENSANAELSVTNVYTIQLSETLREILYQLHPILIFHICLIR